MGYYNQEIEKIAARRWKRNIGSMDPKDYRRLFDAGVLNIPREIKGLNKGSENIAKRYNAFFDTDGSKFREYIKKHNPKSDIDKLDYQRKVNSYGYMTPTPNLKSNDRIPIAIGSMAKDLTEEEKQNILNSNINGISNAQKMRDFANRADTTAKVRKGKKVSEYYMDALAKRHEVDELRSGVKLARKGLGDGGKNKYLAHNSPEVIYRESANAAPALPSIRQMMRSIRRKERENLAANGVIYGDSGVLQKKNMNRHIKKFFFKPKNNTSPTLNVKPKPIIQQPNKVKPKITKDTPTEDLLKYIFGEDD